jgi:HK97 family phage major capsid protein
VIEETIPGLLEPLYADSIIAKLGVRMYSGMPLSDIRVPAMGAGTAGWVGEVTAAGATNNTFSSVLLQPKRITAYMDISKELIVQDTIGVEDALKRDIYNALVSKMQETFLSADAATTTKPAGIFNGITATNIDSYEALCDAEAKVDDSNVGGEKKYLMSNKAKAIVRSMAKSALTNELVLTNNNIDGTEVIANSQVPTTMYAFGNFDNIVFAQFGDIEVVVDEYTQAINGCVRLVINAYFDWKKVRADQDVLVYGTVSRPAANNG